MGKNTRYGSEVSEAAINEFLTRPKPISLTPSETGDRATRAPEPIPVRAWVRFPEVAIEVDGEVIGWTRRAVRVRFTVRDGAVFETWVWASAVERR